ncbi:MAG: Arc family DNA-binding protein [Longimicrobiales bacterium]|nr:Arc family DNA-binding protein [Longimicrobiales bacterium]
MPDVILRGIPPALHGEIKEAAVRNRRSVNAEILARLEASIRPKRIDVDALFARVREREARFDLPVLDEVALRTLKDEGRP